MSASRAIRLHLFAITAPGLESIAAQELRRLGIVPRGSEPGGVTFEGPLDILYRANLWSRTASRIIARAGEFHAASFSELEKRARRLPWERFVRPGRAVRLHVTCRKSRLYHSDAVAERVAAAIESRMGGVNVGQRAAGAPDEDDDGADDQLIVVRLHRDRCTTSVDTSGALLHRRGYRLATTRAPLRETLAASALLASEWTGAAPLLDPMCGSGTIPIEAALIARRIAPGSRRSFAFMQWPDFDGPLWEKLHADALAQVMPSSPGPILGSDRDAGAIEAAHANAERAGVGSDVLFERRSISAIEPPRDAGWVVTNPPYGTRVGDTAALRDLYARFGDVVRRRCPGWTVTMISGNPRLERHTAIAFEELARTRNGGIPVRLLRGKV